MPASVRVEEVAVSRPGVAGRREHTSAAQHLLAGHELAVVFPDRTVGNREAGVGLVRRRSPFPAVAEELAESTCGRPGSCRVKGEVVALLIEDVADDRIIGSSSFPLELGGQASARPCSERVGFVVRDMNNGFMQIDRP